MGRQGEEQQGGGELKTNSMQGKSRAGTKSTGGDEETGGAENRREPTASRK